MNLFAMYLQSNQLTGSIPEALGGLTNFQYLYLYGNQLTSNIPDSLGNLINLRQLYLNNNQLTGSIPDALGNLTNLMELNLYHNQLTGSIPDTLWKLSNLTSLSLGENQLTGTIPDMIGNLTNLTYLSLNNNQFSGSIPASIGSLTNLNHLYLYSTQLTGTIPDTIGNLVNLNFLYLLNNHLMGAVPTAITNLTNLTNLNIENNQLVDLPDLSPLTNLEYLVAQNNRFTFEDIEPNIGVPNSAFNYSPQDSVGDSKDTTLNINDHFEMSIQVGGTVNQYQWVKDGVDISGASDSIYIISSASTSDSGSYHCRITNTIATDLTLYSRPVQVNVFDPTGLSGHTAALPKTFELYQNFPNPFNPVTNIKFALPKSAKVKIDIFNILGQHVTTLINTKKEAGYHSVQFDANLFTSGMYFYIITADNFHNVKRMLLIK